MPDLSVEQVHEMAKAAGLKLDDARATTIASRLSAVRAELDSIPSESLMAVEPASSFVLPCEETPPTS